MKELRPMQKKKRHKYSPTYRHSRPEIGDLKIDSKTPQQHCLSIISVGRLRSNVLEAYRYSKSLKFSLIGH
ncbi:hypothetical protein MANES_08G070924v8 [Manihot esculenta]|uniref:Uncharacterized protein n=1 Tax=Manihot esculenta TaxID=3983 RepID=A0ACB7HE29_MANES|nr:hypothetical protein MANES_08G070924v8 [Manihot esculenta]